jgi:hypothetical protein
LRADFFSFGRSHYIGEAEDNNVKVDLYYHDEIIDPCDVVDGILIASLADVTAMKVDARISQTTKRVYTRAGADNAQFYEFHRC